MILMTKEQLLTALKPKHEKIDFGGGSVCITEVGAHAFYDICNAPEYQVDGELDTAKFNAALLAHSVTDSDGNRLFADGDIPVLMRSSYAPFLKLVDAVKRVNGLSGEEVKNSEADQSKSSCIDCACTSGTGIQDSL